MIEVEDVNGPVEWEEKFGLWNGSALGMSHEMFQVTWFRPSTRHAVYGNLFFVGASTHPGTGVPIVLCGAKLVAQQILSCIHRGTFRHAPTPFSTLLSLQSVLLTVFGAMMAAVVWSLMAGVAGVEVVG
ncbi:hypothetical protein HK104_009388 [Borealophlyctis nickersoniae]|nr:hypothetical protein HK104_009388 [Borealophlyctis nickersoniae]